MGEGLLYYLYLVGSTPGLFLELYGPQLAAGIGLVSVTLLTLFRRSLSCNHVYAGSKDTDSKMTERVAEKDDWDHPEMLHTLEQASNFCAARSPLCQLIVDAASSSCVSSSMRQQEDADEWLDRAGHYCSLAGLLFPKSPQRRRARPASPPSSPSNPQAKRIHQCLSDDLRAQILEYLHPHDVLSYAQVNAVSSAFCRTNLLWRRLVQRDYAWLWGEYQHLWNEPRQRLEAPFLKPDGGSDGFLGSISDFREFYFSFQYAWVDWLLAGQATAKHCLVGLQGHVYDLTAFLHSHPGSPETVLVHAGKDSTAFFENIGHSSGARRLAQSLCLVVDRSLSNGDQDFGLRPTSHFSGIDTPVGVVEQPPVITTTASVTKRYTLKSIQVKMNAQYRAACRDSARRFGHRSLTVDVNVYYDPFRCCFVAWYLNLDLEPSFEVLS